MVIKKIEHHCIYITTEAGVGLPLGLTFKIIGSQKASGCKITDYISEECINASS